MTETAPEPAEDPGTLPGEADPTQEPDERPELPDPSFPEVLPGGEDAPDHVE